MALVSACHWLLLQHSLDPKVVWWLAQLACGGAMMLPWAERLHRHLRINCATAGCSAG